MLDQSRNEILALLASREQYKNKNIKQCISLDSEDSIGVEVSGETCLLASRQASSPVASTPSQLPFGEGTSCQERDVSNNAPRELYTRWSGISVHHVRSKKGVKIGITLQKPEWVSEGRTLQITAELKRYDRLREVKPNADDSDFFAEYLNGVKNTLHENKNKTACLGRAHQRGARRAWIQDTLVLGYLVDGNINEVLLYIEGEQIEISMNHQMSDAQQRVYYSTGIHGRIQLRKRSPRIDDLPTTRYA